MTWGFESLFPHIQLNLATAQCGTMMRTCHGGPFFIELGRGVQDRIDSHLFEYSEWRDPRETVSFFGDHFMGRRFKAHYG